MLPAIVSQLVVIVKDTALGGAVLTYSELLASANTMSGYYGANVIASFTVVAVIFIALNFALTSLRELAGAPAAASQEVDGRGRRVRTTWPTAERAEALTLESSARDTLGGSGMIATAPGHLTQAPAMGCIRSVIVHPAPTSCSPTSLGTPPRAGGAAPWTR